MNYDIIHHPLLEQGCLSQGKDGAYINIYVQPRAAKNGFVGIHDGAIKLRITAPPVDGKANSMIIAILAKLLRRPKADISLTSGQQSRKKRFKISGSSLTDLLASLRDIV
ncbi:MAG: YggU family protein [Deltaproteobacteria bacterium]|nr:YggU family protein [Deltaproteobacteria bacterium]